MSRPGRQDEGATASLGRTMGAFGALLITLSNLSPSIGVFVVGSEVMHQAGAATFACFLAAALLGVPIANIYAELAAAVPEAGGEYTIVGRLLGAPWGFALLGLNLLTFSIAPAMTALGVASYLRETAPGLPAVPTAMALVAVCTGVAVLNIRVNAWVTGLFLFLELASLLLVSALGFAHPQPGAMLRLVHPGAPGAGGALHPATLASVSSGIAAAIYAFDGYGSVVYLGEEIEDAPRRMAWVVFSSLGLAALFQLAPLLAVEVGAPSLPRLFAAPTPLLQFMGEAGGPGLQAAMSLAVALALFNAMIASAVMGGRQLYSSGRDRAWPRAFSRAFAALHPRFGSPWIATVVLGVSAVLWCFVKLEVLVLLIGDGTAAIYFCMALAALRARRLEAPGAYLMPLHPLLPVLALLILLVLGATDLFDPAGREGLLASAVTVALATAYYFGVVRRAGRWAHRGPSAGQRGYPITPSRAPRSPRRGRRAAPRRCW